MTITVEMEEPLTGGQMFQAQHLALAALDFLCFLLECLGRRPIVEIDRLVLLCEPLPADKPT